MFAILISLFPLEEQIESYGDEAQGEGSKCHPHCYPSYFTIAVAAWTLGCHNSYEDNKNPQNCHDVR